MIDFATLRLRTDAEREADERQRLANQIALDRARRDERSQKSLVLTLTSDAELSYTTAGAAVLNMRGSDERARPAAAVTFLPDDFDRPREDDVLDRLRAGVAVRLDGYWRAKTVNGRKLFEFVAQYLAIGDEPRIP